MPNKLVLYLLEEDLDTLRFDGREGHSVTSRSPLIRFGQHIGLVERLHLADVDVQTPETPGPFGLRLEV